MMHTYFWLVVICYVFYYRIVPTSATCTPESCFNGGTCFTDANREIRCICPENYIGSDCSESISCTNNVQCGNKACKVYQGQNYCDCGNDLTGFFCDVAISQDTSFPSNEGIINNLIHYWSFNFIPFGRLFVDSIQRNHFTRYGDARLYRSTDLENVVSLNRFGSGSLISGALNDACLVSPYNCTEGLTISFWLQFISGGIIIRTGKAGFHVYVEGGKFFITYQGMNKRWTIERSCIPMGVFFVTSTWSEAGGLSYYENGKPVVSTQIFDLNSISGNFDDVITVGYEETSSEKRYSSLIIDDLMLWNRTLSSEDVQAIYDTEVSTTFGRASCLSEPCDSWCVQGGSSTEHTCIQPTNNDCSFENDLCGFNGLYATITSSSNQNAIIENMPYHDHTFGNCTVPPSKYLKFTPTTVGDSIISFLSSNTFESPRGHLFRFRFWYFMYGQDDGFLIAHITRGSTTSVLWSTTSRNVRNWQFQQIEMKAAQSFSLTLTASANSGVNLTIALDDVSLQVCDPYLQPTITNVSLADNGGVIITWLHAGCFEIFPLTTLVYYRTSNSTEWTLHATTKDSFHVISSILFPPNATFEFKVNTRYVFNNEIFISDDSAVFNFTIPESFISSTLTFEAAPALPSSVSISNHGWLLNRGTNVTVTCKVASVTKPTIILKKNRIIYPTEQLKEITDPPSEGANIWQATVSILSFEDNDAAKYICEIKSGNDSVLSRILYLNIQGSFMHVQHNSSSSEFIVDYDSRFEFFLRGLGGAYDEISFERKDWLTGQYVRSEAQLNDGLYENFYIAFTGVYDKCRCAQTGQHRFKVVTNGVNILYYDFDTLRLTQPDPPQSVTVTHNGTSRAQVTWNSPGCNGGPIRSVRISFYHGTTSTPTFFQSNETTWNSLTGAGSYIIENYAFEVNVEYNWTMAVLYDNGNETVWSQESSLVSTKISDEFDVKISLHDENSFVVKPGSDGLYKIELGQSIIISCTVVSITRPQRTWSKRTYQGYETVQSQEFQPKFSSSGFEWISTITISQFNYTDSGQYNCSGTAGSNYSSDYATISVYAPVIFITTSIMPENYTIPYNSTFQAEIILQGLPTYKRDFQIRDWRTETFSSIKRQTFLDIDGYLKVTAEYNSFKCSNTGIHRAVLEMEDYSQFQYELPSPLLISEPDPPQITSVTAISQSMIKLIWSAGQCNMGYPTKISITVFKRNGDLLKESILNITSYDENTGVGVTLVEKGQDFNESYTEWIIKMLYTDSTGQVWSRPSQAYFATVSGSITISFQSNSSSSFSTRITLVGHQIKRNESVTITCQTLAAEALSNFTWFKRTFENHSALSGNNVRFWNKDDYLYGSLTLDYFDYSHCGVYSCKVNIGNKLQEVEMPLSIEAPVLVEHVSRNLNSNVHHGSLRIIKFLLLGYPQPQTYAERLVQPDSYWRNYTDYLPALSEDVYWTVELRRNLTCADTGLVRLVILDENVRTVFNVEGRTPLIDPDQPTVVYVEYLSETHANVTWNATGCNFASVEKINIYQNGSSVLSYADTNWNNETEIGYQIVENITVVEHQTYFWNISVVYGEGVEEATSQSSPVFEAPVVGVNECLVENSCDVNATCINKIGTYDCQCNVGFSGNGFNCSNIDECLTNYPCHVNASCIDTEGSFLCECHGGYSGNGFNCANIDECLSNPCHINANCTDIEGSFVCQCNSGYSGNGFNCSNIDECLTNYPCHVNASCIDTEGSFLCECHGGYAGNGFNCTNIDECLSNPCHINANCTDIEGSFVCQCNSGYSGNGFDCSNIDECLSSPCHTDASCTNTEGSFVCQCNTGYSGNGFNCSNIDECLSNPCHFSASCIDTEGSFACECNNGYSGSGFNCSNIDECLSNPCHFNASCIDIQGSFACECNNGYSGNGFNCSNIDECLKNPCHVNASCTNTEGSFVCHCHDGYSGNGFNCSNIDECLTLSNLCHVNASCADTEGSFVCQCNNGYSGFNCSNIDECLLNPCHQYAGCTDTDGSFYCQCNAGFSGNGFSCIDVNECLNSTDNCNINAYCSNTFGSFDCECKAGFFGDGIYCSIGKHASCLPIKYLFGANN